ncbi:MAG: carbohydrate ABC transporter substrate-binding protein [Clostridiales bacterium]|nr:carbohydrate ABC transporter substrate-binding protein [Clostridiales bacterium]
MNTHRRLRNHNRLVGLCVIVMTSFLLSSCASGADTSSTENTTATSLVESQIDESQTSTEGVTGFCYANEIKVKIADTEGVVNVYDVSGAGGEIAVIASVLSEDWLSERFFLLIYDARGNQVGKQEIFSQVTNVGRLTICDNGTDTLLIRNNAPLIEVFRIHTEDASMELISQLSLPEMMMADPRVQLLPTGTIVLNGFSGDGSSDDSLLFYETDGTFLGRYSNPFLLGGVIYWDRAIYAPLINYSGTMDQLVPINSTDWTGGEPIDTIQFSDPRSVMYHENVLYETNGKGIFLYDESSSKGTQVVDWRETDLDSVTYNFTDSFSVVSENCFTCFTPSSPPYDEFVILTCSDTHPKDGKTELVIGGFLDSNATLIHAIHQFNAASDDYYVSVVDYSEMKNKDGNEYNAWEGGYEQLYLTILTEMISGSGPDLLFFGRYGHDSADCCHFEQAGYLLDLSPYLRDGEENALDAILPNVLEASMSGDKLFKLPYATSVEFLFPHQDVFLSSINTIGDYEQVMGAFPEGSVALNNLTQSELLLRMFMYNYDALIYEVDDSIVLNTELLTEILNFSKKYGWSKQLRETVDESDRNYWQYYTEGRIALIEQGFCSPFDFSFYRSEAIANGFSKDPIPLPCHSNSIGCIRAVEMIAVTSTTLHPEGAAMFVRFLLDKEIQSYVWGYCQNMPVRKEIFDYIIGDVPYPDDFAEYSRAVDKDDYEMWGFITDNWTQAEIQEAGKLFKPVFLGSNYLYYPDRDIEKIILEESAAFFENQKSAEDVAKIIENRLFLIIAERGGLPES